MKQPIREKRHRLIPELYVGERVVSFTGCVKYRKKLFTNLEIFLKMEEFLLSSMMKHQCDAYIYLFMPNHFHFILTGNNEKSSIKKCIDLFKQKSGFYISQNQKGYRWQKDYYDRILRQHENLIANIKYILNNPVRAGIVDYWKDYKFMGSTIYNLDNWE